MRAILQGFVNRHANTARLPLAIRTYSLRHDLHSLSHSRLLRGALRDMLKLVCPALASRQRALVWQTHMTRPLTYTQLADIRTYIRTYARISRYHTCRPQGHAHGNGTG